MSVSGDAIVTEDKFLPYGRPTLDESDIAAVTEVLRSDWLTTGPKIPALESALANRFGAAQAVVCSSGTAALHLACIAAGLGPGSAAIVPSMTFLATANAVRMTGADVVFADVNSDTGLMEPSHLTEAWSRAEAAGLRIKAVLPVDLAGQCADLATISRFARVRGAIVIEDACHAIGTKYRDSDHSTAPVGSCRYGQMTVFSFHPVKTVAGGEGGAVLTADDAAATRMRQCRSHGMSREAETFQQADMAFGDDGAPNPWYYEMTELGWNYRLSDIHAALALSQLARLDEFVAIRRDLAKTYDTLLQPVRGIVTPIRRKQGCVPAWHLYPVLIDFRAGGLDRAAVMTRLRNAGIGTMVHYIPVHLQPYYRQRNGALVLPGAEAYYQRTLSLPLHAGMTTADIERVVSVLMEIFADRIDEPSRAAAPRRAAAKESRVSARAPERAKETGFTGLARSPNHDPAKMVKVGV